MEERGEKKRKRGNDVTHFFPYTFRPIPGHYQIAIRPPLSDHFLATLGWLSDLLRSFK